MEIMLARFARIAGGFSVFFLLVLFITGCGGKGSPTLPDSSDQNANLGQPDSQDLNSGLTPAQSGLSINPLAGIPTYVDDEVLVVLNDSTVSPGASMLSGWPLRLRETIECRWGTVYRCAITDGSPVLEITARLKTEPSVRFAEPNFLYYFTEVPYFPNDPLWAYTDDPDDPTDSAYDQWGPAMIGASVLWNDFKGTEDVIVAIMDTGVRRTHEDLEANIWINEDEDPDNGIDDDLNGWIDDWWGWDGASNDNDPWDDGSSSYHGSACAGVCAAVQDNERGVSGVAPGVKIMPLRISFDTMELYLSSFLENLEYAVVNRADIVSMSFRGYEYSEIMDTACEDAWDGGNGLILIGGIGNEDTTEICYPNGYESVMAIGGTCPFSEYQEPRDETRIKYGEDGYYWGSNYGAHMDVMGYGAQYTTTYGGHYDSYWDGYYNGFFGGTSCATPFAAGVMALIRSYFPAESPAWSWQRMTETADDLDVPGFDIQTGHGRVNALRAIYGPDRYSDLEDAYGFVPITFDEVEMFDTIHHVPFNPYLDTQDLYKVTMDATGTLIVELRIFTWGENLDLAVFKDKDLTQLAAQSTGPNHYNDTVESVEIGDGTPGSTYYIKVFSPASGNSTTYGLKVQQLSNVLNVTGESLTPPFINQSGNIVPFLKLTLEIGWHATLDGLNISKSGTLANPDLALVRLYRDTNENGIFDDGDFVIGLESPPGTNRIQFSGLDIFWTYEEPLVLFVAADIGFSPDDCDVRLSLESYQHVFTEEGNTAHYSQFPINSGLVNIGTDTDPPVWLTTTGVQSATPAPGSAILAFNGAYEDLTPPVMYNIYYTDTLPFDIGAASIIPDVATYPGSTTDLEAKASGLMWGKEWYFVVRVEDQAGNEDDNLNVLSCTPEFGGDPANPIILNTYPTPCNNVDFDDDLLVVTRNWAGIAVYDRSNPIGLSKMADWDGGDNYLDVAVSGDFCYLVGQYKLTVLDLTDPENPVLVTTYEDIEPDHIVANGNWVYANESYPNRLLVMDVSDPYDIQFAEDLPLNAGYKRDMLVYGNKLYMAHGNNGVIVFDITDPSAPTQLDNFGPTNLVMMDIDNGVLTTINTIVYITTYDYATSPTDPPLLDLYIDEDGSMGEDICSIGDYVYASSIYQGIFVYDVTDPSDITKVGVLPFNHIEGMVNDGPIIYAAAANGLNVVI